MAVLVRMTIPSLTTLLFLFSANSATALSDFGVTTTNFTIWNQTEWSLTASEYHPGQFQSRISLSNGYVGASLAAAGPFFEVDVNQTDANGTQPTNGWPLFNPRISFSTISGFFDVQPNTTGSNHPWLNQYGWESVIAGIPHSTGILFDIEGHVLDSKVDNATISNFTSSMNFKTGIAHWNYTWTPSTTPIAVSFSAFFSRSRPNVVAVKSTIRAEQDVNGSVTDILDGGSSVRSYSAGKGMSVNGSTIWSAVHPNGLSNITGYVYSTADFSNTFTNMSSREPVISATNDTTFGQKFSLNLKAGKTATFHKFVGVASTDKFPSTAETVAHQSSLNASCDGWATLSAEHASVWRDIMPESSVDSLADPVTGDLPSDPYLQILHISAIANTFYILQNIQPDNSGLNDDSIAVGGLASDSYAGLIFWDADYWMAPGLNLAFPSLAKQISNFRVKQYPQALANAAFNGYPNGSSLYPWTAGRYGNCTGTGPCVQYEYHLNYDIAFNLLQQYNVTNNKTSFESGPRDIISSTAMMTGQLLTYNDTTKSWWIINMTDPDEYANNVDNGAFTIASASRLLELENQLSLSENMTINTTWAAQAENIELPRALSNITLEYQTMNDSVEVKQADVVLLIYPLDYNNNGYGQDEKFTDLEYYSNRQSSDGPAMTYSAFAISRNAVSISGCAVYTSWLKSTLPYLRAPFYQFSEQTIDDYDLNGGTNPAYPFLTGHGGALQVVPFGLLGVRTDQDMLYIDPSLPPQVPYVKVRDIYYAGAGLRTTMNQTHTNITRFATTNIPSLSDKYAKTTLPFRVGTPGASSTNTTTYTLALNQTLTIPNRIYSTTLTTANNLLQCLPLATLNSLTPGQFPSAATDGSSSTRWQPLLNSTSTLSINTTSLTPQPLSAVHIDWGMRPASTATIYIGNSTTSDNGTLSTTETAITLNPITISSPYNATTAAEAIVVSYQGNMTELDISTRNLWSGDYVRLEIEGCLAGDGDAATVAELEILGMSEIVS